jgi:hypothetical protein
MKTLKLALLSTGAVGAVAAGGFAYATVGGSSPATGAKLPNASKVVQHGPAVPQSVPTCLPKAVSKHVAKLPKLPGAGQLPKVPGTDQLPQAPSTNQLPKVPGAGQLPKVPGTNQLPQAPGTDQLPQAPGTNQLPSAPNSLPTCLPQAPSNPSANLPALPAQPNLPGAPNLASCSSMPPAIRMEGGRAKDITLPNGMHMAFSHFHSVMVNGRKVCANIQKFAGAAGQFFTVERLNTPPQTNMNDVVKALKLPASGNIVSASGLNTWQSPLNNGSMWLSDKGYAISLSGSPAMAGALPGIASQLRHIG